MHSIFSLSAFKVLSLLLIFHNLTMRCLNVRPIYMWLCCLRFIEFSGSVLFYLSNLEKLYPLYFHKISVLLLYPSGTPIISVLVFDIVPQVNEVLHNFFLHVIHLDTFFFFFFKFSDLFFVISSLLLIPYGKIFIPDAFLTLGIHLSLFYISDFSLHYINVFL